VRSLIGVLLAASGCAQLAPQSQPETLAGTSWQLHDQLVKHWPYVRSYLIKGGRLYLSLMADGGIYEFEPAK